jgi:zinc/manganese transport system ATP-binding protein
VLFARVLVQDSPLILLDEPFNAIDTRTAADLMALIERWHGERRTVIAVLHDLDLVKERFPEAMLLSRDLVAWGPTREAVTSQNLLKARAMAERWNDDAPFCERRTA